ncbi:MAG TPA: hypothetical protein VFC74_02845 [Oscillospiraceae bacterium]|nr:hypothetical protein [Oscillospiraceae bacterium]
MFKWSTSTADQEPLRLNNALLWTLMLIVVSALGLGLFPWLTFLATLHQYQQSLMLWGL